MCSAPPSSSHELDLLSTKLLGAAIPECLVRSAFVVPLDPHADRSACVGDGAELVLPDALLLHAAEESLHDPILLRGVGRDELLPQSIVATGRAEAPALEDQAVVAAHDRRLTRRPQSAKARQAGVLEGALGFLGPCAQGELVADELAIVAINHGGQVRPAVPPAVDVRDVHGPAFVASLGTTAPALHPRPRCADALRDEPRSLSTKVRQSVIEFSVARALTSDPFQSLDGRSGGYLYLGLGAARVNPGAGPTPVS